MHEPGKWAEPQPPPRGFPAADAMWPAASLCFPSPDDCIFIHEPTQALPYVAFLRCLVAAMRKIINVGSSWVLAEYSGSSGENCFCTFPFLSAATSSDFWSCHSICWFQMHLGLSDLPAILVDVCVVSRRPQRVQPLLPTQIPWLYSTRLLQCACCLQRCWELGMATGSGCYQLTTDTKSLLCRSQPGPTALWKP